MKFNERVEQILEEKERCWSIKEKRPIKVYIDKTSSNGKINLIAKPMTMKYETWEHLDQHHRFDDIGVSGTGYNYFDGEAEFRATNKEELQKWLDNYKKIIKLGK